MRALSAFVLGVRPLAIIGPLAVIGPLAAQERPPPASGWSTERPAPMLPPPSGSPAPPQLPLRDADTPAHTAGDPSPGRAFLLSAALPGTAQLALSQWRWPLYLAAEVGGWYGYLHHRGDARDLRAQYRTLAWEIPRQGFADERRDADFAYYERMAEWPASGAFDADVTAPGVQPEPDPSTFNGSVWTLARNLFAVDEEADPDSESYRSARQYYEDRAVAEELRWDWAGRHEDQQRFVRLIRASDQDFRRATTLVGLLVGNHLLSAVDGYLSARLRQRDLPDARVRVLPGEGAALGATWILRMEIVQR